MSLHYLLDGYNIIKQEPDLVLKKLEDAREKLLSLIEIYRPQGSIRNRVTVIFDGKSGIVGSHRSHSVEVFFTTQEPADNKIKRLVTQAANKRQIVVVTNDRDIIYYVRPLGAQILSVQDFLNKCQAKEKRTAGAKAVSHRPDDERKYISASLEHEITSELKGIWLKDKEDRGDEK